jgi:nitrogen regulatory protein P-II 1
MKEVKAYIQHHRIDKVIETLKKKGFNDMTLIDVRGITRGIPREEYHYSLELAEKYMDVIKLEIVCKDQDAEKIVEIIMANAHTGRKGDGLIFVTPVETVVRIRTGEKGEAALRLGDQGTK